MKNSDLDRALKSAAVPERPEAYWEEFPRRVAAEARRLKSRPEAAAGGLHPAPLATSLSLRWAAFGLGAAVLAVCLTFALGLWQGRPGGITRQELAAARKYFHEIEALFPHQVRAIVLGRDAPRLVLADQPNVAASRPLFLRIRGPRGSQDYVTFSGQQIRFDGEVCEVLLDHQGEVLLIGPKAVWSAAKDLATSDRYQVDACPLEATL